jgi:SAM-dependent methyltransferase
MSLKLHLGNGTVYLKGYVNIDLAGKLASLHPDIAKHNETTVDKYYKFPFRQNKDNNVTDMHMDVRFLLFDDASIEEILTVNLIDHLTKEDFLTALEEWKRVLRVGGKLIIDVDDRRKQAEILTSAETPAEIEWALRLIYCNEVGKRPHH